MTNRSIIFHQLALCLSFSVSFSSVAAKDCPNILYIFTDDQSVRMVSCYPEAYSWIKTPNIDALAREGVRFRTADMAPFCVPSRSSQLTGNRHTQRVAPSMAMS